MKEKHLKKAVALLGLLGFFGCFFFAGSAHAATFASHEGVGGSYTSPGYFGAPQYFVATHTGVAVAVRFYLTTGSPGTQIVIIDQTQGLTLCGSINNTSSTGLFELACNSFTVNAGDVLLVQPQGGNTGVYEAPTASSTFPYFEVYDDDPFVNPPDSFMTNIPAVAGTSSLQIGTQYSSSTLGTSTLIDSTSLLSFLNVPLLLSTKVPFGYFFEAKDAILNSVSGSSTTPIPSGTFSVRLGNSTTTVDMFSTSTVGYFLKPTMVTLLRGLMVAVLYIEFLYLLYLRGKATHII